MQIICFRCGAQHEYIPKNYNTEFIGFGCVKCKNIIPLQRKETNEGQFYFEQVGDSVDRKRGRVW